MKWSAHLTYKRYLLARALTLPTAFYVYILALFVIVGAYSGSGSVVYLVTYLLFVAVIMVGSFCLAVYAQLRRMRRVTGATIMNYEITNGAIKLSAGKDGITLPLNEFTFKRQGRHFLCFKRKKVMLGTLLLMFDDQETMQRAKALLTK